MNSSSSSLIEQINRGSEDRGQRPYIIGRGGRIGFQVKCFKCGEIGHKSFECPGNVARKSNMQVVQDEDAKTKVHDEVP